MSVTAFLSVSDNDVSFSLLILFSDVVFDDDVALAVVCDGEYVTGEYVGTEGEKNDPIL